MGKPRFTPAERAAQRAYRGRAKQEAVMEQQYGIRWPTGSVFAFGSKDEAEAELDRDGRGVGVLVVHEYEAGTPNCTEWREVATGFGTKRKD